MSEKIVDLNHFKAERAEEDFTRFKQTIENLVKNAKFTGELQFEWNVDEIIDSPVLTVVLKDTDNNTVNTDKLRETATFLEQYIEHESIAYTEVAPAAHNSKDKLTFIFTKADRS